MAHDRRTRETRQRTNSSTNRQKMIVVGLLSIGLVVALYTQPESTVDSVEANPISLQTLEIKADAMTGGTEPEEFCLATRELPSVNLDELLTRDPFQSTDRRTSKLVDATLQIRAIYGDGDEAVALVGQSIVRKGQRLPDGRRVVRIAPDGIELSN